MKLIKGLIVAGSAIGIYNILKKNNKKRKPARLQKTYIDIQPTNKYKDIEPARVREEFKQRIAAGEWLSEDEYADMTDAMKSK